MPLDSLERLFIDELRDLYSAEKQLSSALKKLAKAASDAELKQAFEEHQRETDGQIERLERVFETVDLKPRAKRCEGIEGIVSEGEELIEEEAEDADPAVLDAALIAGAQRAEHYEISAYGTMRRYAERLGNQEAARLLAQTLDEEKAADQKLNTIAERVVNPKAQKAGAS